MATETPATGETGKHPWVASGARLGLLVGTGTAKAEPCKRKDLLCCSAHSRARPWDRLQPASTALEQHSQSPAGSRHHAGTPGPMLEPPAGMVPPPL